MRLPYVKREIRAQQDMTDANFGHQMPQALRGKDNRIAIQLLLEIFAGVFLNGFAVLAGLHAVIGTSEVRR